MNVLKEMWLSLTIWLATLFQTKPKNKIVSSLTTKDVEIINSINHAELMSELKKINLALASLYAENATVKEVLSIQNEAMVTVATNQEILVHSLSELKLIPSDEEDAYLDQVSEESSVSMEDLSDEEKKRLN